MFYFKIGTKENESMNFELVLQFGMLIVMLLAMKLIIVVSKLGLIKGKLSLMTKVDIIPVMVRLIKVVR